MALQLKKKSAVADDTKWFEYDEDTKLELAGIDNPAYQIALERMRRRLRSNDAKFDEGTVGVVSGEKTEHQNHCLLIGSYLLKDWDGAQDEDGNPLKYTPAIGSQMLESDVDLFVFVLKHAADLSAEGKGELAETVEKPQAGSSGKGSGAAKRKNSEPSTTA